jgi:hypothetical protein
MIMIDNRIALGVAASARRLLLMAGLLGGLSLATTPASALDCVPPCETDDGGTIPDIGPPPDENTDDGDTNTPPTDPNAVPDNGNSSGNGGQTTQPTLPEPQAPAPTVVTPTAVAPVTVTSSVGETFVLSTRVVVQTSSIAPTLVGSGGNDLISRETVIKAMLPDGMKSSAQTAYRLLSTGSIDLLQIEAAASAYKAFSDLDSVEQQTLFEFMFYGPTSLHDGYLALMKILPSDDPFRAKLLQYSDATLAARAASGNQQWAFKRALTLGYAGKIARLSGLSHDTLERLCETMFDKNYENQSHCREAVL